MNAAERVVSLNVRFELDRDEVEQMNRFDESYGDCDLSDDLEKLGGVVETTWHGDSVLEVKIDDTGDDDTNDTRDSCQDKIDNALAHGQRLLEEDEENSVSDEDEEDDEEELEEPSAVVEVETVAEDGAKVVELVVDWDRIDDPEPAPEDVSLADRAGG